MTVRRRLMVSLAALVLCTAVVGSAGVVGVLRLRDRYAAAEEQYSELRSLYEIGHRAATVRQLLGAESPDFEAVLVNLHAAGIEAGKLDARSSALDVREGLQRAERELVAGAPDAELRADVSRWLGIVASRASVMERAIVDNRTAAMHELRSLERVLACLLGATVLGAAGIGVVLYRAIVRPVRAVEGALTSLAAERFDTRLDPCGDLEFQRLMLHLNGMAATLEHLHATMARQVETKSRQLVRSEQLAGVGFLAAGLAHEINNPLGIIAGFAQTTIRKLDGALDSEAREEAAVKARGTLEVICEEAFRCRDIAGRLLDLARPGETEAAPVRLDAMVRRAVDLVSALPVAEGRELRLVAAADDVVVEGSGAELLQVAVNLMTNALEACDGAGTVTVSLSQTAGAAVITITDSGCGMDAETLAHAFEPFFTGKPRRGLSGCGLGLSVSHAIVERHGGRMEAFSDGPGRGSTFSIELPRLVASQGGQEGRDAAA